MKRPEGFDSPRDSGSRARPAKPLRPASEADSRGASTNAPDTDSGVRPPARSGRGGGRLPRASVPAAPSEREHRRALRRVARERRAYERGEIKRFTRRARSRRLATMGAMMVVALLLGVLAIAIYSPILALRTIEVDGTVLVDPSEVRASVDGQLGTPLALLDFSLIKHELAGFSLIRSYVTETVPPSTLKIHIVEREPVGALAVGATFTMVDPAGVVVGTSVTRPDSVPLIKLADQTPNSPGFRAVVKVLLALPAETLAQVDAITASTQDDVTFTLRGVGQRVVWGSADRSAFKSRVLIAMLAKLKRDVRLEVDVSAPESVVVTKR